MPRWSAALFVAATTPCHPLVGGMERVATRGRPSLGVGKQGADRVHSGYKCTRMKTLGPSQELSHGFQ